MGEKPNLTRDTASEAERQRQLRSLLAYYAVLKGLGLDKEVLVRQVDIVWEQSGRGVAEAMKKVLKLGESLEDACATTLAVAQVFGIEIGETEIGKRVTVTRCPVFEIGRNSGFEKERCLAPCLVFNDSVAKAFDPKFSVKRTMAIPQGDNVCEALWVMERCDGQA